MQNPKRVRILFQERLFFFNYWKWITFGFIIFHQVFFIRHQKQPETHEEPKMHRGQWEKLEWIKIIMINIAWLFHACVKWVGLMCHINCIVSLMKHNCAGRPWFSLKWGKIESNDTLLGHRMKEFGVKLKNWWRRRRNIKSGRRNNNKDHFVLLFFNSVLKLRYHYFWYKMKMKSMLAIDDTQVTLSVNDYGFVITNPRGVINIMKSATENWPPTSDQSESRSEERNEKTIIWDSRSRTVNQKVFPCFHKYTLIGWGERCINYTESRVAEGKKREIDTQVITEGKRQLSTSVVDKWLKRFASLPEKLFSPSEAVSTSEGWGGLMDGELKGTARS